MRARSTGKSHSLLMFGVGLAEVDGWPEVAVWQACRREVGSAAGCHRALDVLFPVEVCVEKCFGAVGPKRRSREALG